MEKQKVCDCEKCKCNLSNNQKWKYTLITSIIFLLVILPITYKITNNLLGKIIGKLSENNGSPTTLGIIVHTIIFTLILRFQME